MDRTPIEAVSHWLRNFLDPDLVNSVVAPDAPLKGQEVVTS
jgi:hypothetical protein